MQFKNREFDLFGVKYKLEYINKIECEQEGRFTSGLTNSANHTIQIAKLDYEGNQIDKDYHKIVLLHEIFHAILDEGQYQQASCDETMVEWLAKCIKSLIDQKVL